MIGPPASRSSPAGAGTWQTSCFSARVLILIPDSTPGFGFLDDAIMVELMVRELKHEIEAYADFCNYRSREEKRTGTTGMDRAGWLDGKRKELHSRMRRRRKSERGGGGVRFKLL